MLTYLKTIRFRWSDLCLFVFGVLGAILCIESNYLMTVPNPADTHMSFWVYILFFVILVCAFGLYMFLETKRNGIKVKEYICIGMMLIGIMVGLIALLSAKNVTTVVIEDLNKTQFTITTTITNETKTIHCFALLFLIFGVTALLVHFSKRITNIRFISFAIYVFYLVSFALLIYSLIMDDYISLFSTMFSGKPFEERIEELAPIGAFGNKNVYGKFLELGLFLSLINYSLTNRKHNLIIGAFYYIHLLITICKIGILCATIVLFLYLVVNLVLSIIEKKKNRIIFYTSTLTTIFIAIIIIIILVNFNETINNLFVYFKTHLHSLLSRNDLWSYSMQINKNTSLFFGAGYGVFNSILLNTNTTIMGEPLWSSHSFFFTLIGRNGVLYVAFFFMIVIYSIHLSTRLFPKNKFLIIATLCLELSFFMHSCFEDYYDMVFLATMLILVYDNVNNKNTLEISNQELHI